MKHRNSILSGYRGRFIPYCNADGSFRALQCWGAVKVCWCVDMEGNEKFGTRTKFPVKPDCDRDGKLSYFVFGCSKKYPHTHRRHGNRVVNAR